MPLNGLGPKYISDLLPFEPCASSGTGLLTVPRVEAKHGEAALSFYPCTYLKQTSRKLEVCSNSQLV